MKKTLIACVLGCAALLAARDVAVPLNSAKIGAASIPGWIINKSNPAADYGKAEIIAGSEADEKAFKVTAPADRNATFYSTKAYPAKVGEKIEFSAKVKGKGRFLFGFYGYAANGVKYLDGIPNRDRTFDLTDTLTEIKVEIVITASPQGEIGTVRPFFATVKGSELIIEDLEIDIEDKNDD